MEGRIPHTTAGGRGFDCEIMSRMTYGCHRPEVTTTASLSVAAKDANVMSAVIKHVKKNNTLTFIDDTGLRLLFEKWSN